MAKTKTKTKTEKPYLLPGEFRRHITDAGVEEDPGTVALAIAEAWQRRHPALLKTCPGRYYVPTSSATMLYLEEPAAHRMLMMSAIGPANSMDYWYRLALAASAARDVRDWTLLGWLAFQADAALASARTGKGVRGPVVTDESSGSEPHTERLVPEQVCRAFHKVFNLSVGVLYPADYVSGALSYFYALPKSFAVIPDLIGYGPAKEPENAGQGGESPSESEADDAADDDPAYAVSGEGELSWGMLRTFWSQYHYAWKRFPDAIQALADYPNPFLSFLAEQIRNSEQTAPESGHRPFRVENPFGRLIGPKAWGPATGSAFSYELASDEAAEVVSPSLWSPLEQDAPPVQTTGWARPPSLPRRRFLRLKAMGQWAKRRLPRWLRQILPAVWL